MRYRALHLETDRLEPATAEGFDTEAYCLANPDIAAWALRGGDPRYHLEQHGLSEGRKQLDRQIVEQARARRTDKYALFEHVLDPSRGESGTFRFAGADRAFPVAYGTDFASLDHYQSESAHGGLGQFDDEIEANPDKLYLEVGCGLRAELQQNCLYLEVYPSRTADIVMTPACRYPIASGSLDGIGCFAVLEHVPEPWIAAQEFRRMLKPGGKVFIDWPFLAPVHGYPSHFYNATRAGLERMFADGFDLVEIDTRANQTPERILLWLVRGWLDGVTDASVREEFGQMTLAQLLEEPPHSPFWKRVLAATPADIRMTYAAGNTLVARRKTDG
jgi:SAM-dependent methyltransferase